MFTEFSVQAITQNLKDAGCDSEMITEFFDKSGKKDEQLKMLAVQRTRLLDRVHKEEKRINCLDYLVYQMTK
ncbi:hypothetical protein B5F53_10035 [Blautia sp. An249]|uniref:hypothetical protein n=1 Tax=Blautia sp. An249 TaxID=1965603 RepID=UPI000B3A5CB2|nr:hypothetical protein [Blautia sp. An249]OUO78616.1 hypothetical protein B5F53_10035 [Blautia sp. An249]